MCLSFAAMERGPDIASVTVWKTGGRTQHVWSSGLVVISSLQDADQDGIQFSKHVKLVTEE